jgi:hypothetical protein
MKLKEITSNLLLLRFLSLDVNTSNARRPPNAPFWVIAQQVVVIPYSRFGTTYLPHFQE